MGLIDIEDFSAAGWHDGIRGDERSHWYCDRLEAGDILHFSRTPFPLPADDLRALRDIRQRASAHVKNISYRPAEDRVRGVDGSAADRDTVRRCLRAYATSVRDGLASFLSPYAARWRQDFASYRPFEEEGRRLSLSARNDLLHVDSFPTRPTNGSRILRIFTNVNPADSRVWYTTDPFGVVAGRYGVAAGLASIAARSGSRRARTGRLLRRVGRMLGLRLQERSPYDRVMLAFHHWMKASNSFQKESPRYRWEFRPGSTWLVFTDMVPHAVVSGRHALEQTFFVPVDALLRPERAPLRIAEALCGRSLAG